MTNWANAASCKRCGVTFNKAGTSPVQRTDNGYPQGHFSNEAKSGEIIKPCIHCGQRIGLKRWDSWNGFLVRCPHCGGLHGKHWKIRALAFASLLFSAFSFLMTMRLRNAIISISVFVVFAIIGNYLLTSGTIPDMFAMLGVIGFFLGPLVINGVVYVKHERDLDDSTPPKQALLQ